MTARQMISVLLLTASCSSQPDSTIITVTGEIPASQMGTTLEHEHIVTDIFRQDDNQPETYTAEQVTGKVIPELEKAKALGVRTLVECTPAYVGRDVKILKDLSETTGMYILTNTGYYGAQNNRFLPPEVLLMPAEELAQKWISEFEHGIEGTGIRPGFIKIGVDRKPLSEFHATLVRAAALTHKATGLTIMAHSGPAVAAFQELDILKEEGVSPEAFIWTHATDEKDSMKLVQAAKMGAWVSADKFAWDKKMTDNPLFLKTMKDEGVLHRLLISHDAGWFDPGQPDLPFKPYTTIFEELIPNLKKIGFTEADIEQLLVKNPAEAFTVRKRLIKE
ncbi:MAG: phosphotriesterase [Prolixibacteraceae bacterium]